MERRKCRYGATPIRPASTSYFDSLNRRSMLPGFLLSARGSLEYARLGSFVDTLARVQSDS